MMLNWIRAVACAGFLALTSSGANADDISSAQTAVRSLLKDPDSAQFLNVRKTEGSSFVCGLVNAKNGFGGYTGPKPFAYDSSIEMAAIIDGPRSAFTWSSLARGCFPSMKIPASAMEVLSMERSGMWSY